MSEGSSLHHYFFLRGALVQHQQLPWHLDEEAQMALARAASREEKLVMHALASPIANKLQIAPAEVSEAVASFLQGIASQGDTEQLLTKAGLNYEALTASIEAELHAATVLEKLTSDVAPTEQDAYIWFKAHPEKFRVPERREAFQILITVNDLYAENRREMARQRIDTLAQLLRDAPDKFAELALSHSECPSAVEGGRLGVVPPGQLYTELDQELFSLESSAISPVVETPLGFHLVRCGVIEPARQLEWDEVKGTLMQRMTAHQRKWVLQQWMSATESHCSPSSKKPRST